MNHQLGRAHFEDLVHKGASRPLRRPDEDGLSPPLDTRRLVAHSSRAKKIEAAFRISLVSLLEISVLPLQLVDPSLLGSLSTAAEN